MKPAILSKMILVIWLLVIGWIAWGAFGPSSERTRIDAGQLDVEFQQLPELPGSRPIGQRKVVQKSELTSVYRSYASSASFESVLSQYKSTLPAAGWVYESARAAGGATTSIKFCRSSVSLTVGVIEQGRSGTTYSVGVHWGKSPRGAFYCEPSVVPTK